MRVPQLISLVARGLPAMSQVVDGPDDEAKADDTQSDPEPGDGWWAVVRLWRWIDWLGVSAALPVVTRSFDTVAVLFALPAKADIRLGVERLEPVGASVPARAAPADAFLTARSGTLVVLGASCALAEELLLCRAWRWRVHALIRAVGVRAVHLIRTRHLNRSVAARVRAVVVIFAPTAHAVVSVCRTEL